MMESDGEKNNGKEGVRRGERGRAMKRHGELEKKRKIDNRGKSNGKWE